MGKLGLAGTSLTAAVPSGILAYLLLMAVLNQNAQTSVPMTMKVTMFALLALSFLLALFPLYLLIWFRRFRPALASGGAKSGAGHGAAEDDFAEDLVGQEFVDDEEPVENWADSGEVGEITDSMRVDEALARHDEDRLPSSDFDMEEEFSAEVEEFEVGEDTLEFPASDADLDEVESFDETAQEFVDAGDEEFTPAGDLDDEFSFDDFDLDEDEDQKK